MKDVKHFVIEASYKTPTLISRLNMNRQIWISRLAVVMGSTVNVHLKNPGVISDIERNLFEIILIYCIYIFI